MVSPLLVSVSAYQGVMTACRAALEMRAALPELGVEGRIGVNTGEVLTGTEERWIERRCLNAGARFGHGHTLR
jgi:class 3 adenylate cyclase